jgi:hypothetical protein
MRIDASGNVGIGTSSPTQPLSIARGAGVGAGIEMAGNGATLGTNSVFAGQGNDGVFYLFQRAANNMVFGTGNTERMRIDSSGNVGIGVTNPAQKLEVAGGVYIKSGGATSSLFYDSALIFSRAGTGEQARIDSSGNLLFNSGYGSVATAYGCRAWVNFNGTGTVAIRASGNVSSITDNGTGDYTANFTTAMPDVNYSVATNGSDLANSGRQSCPRAIATGSVRIMTTDTPGLTVDYTYVSIAVFR